MFWFLFVIFCFVALCVRDFGILGFLKHLLVWLLAVVVLTYLVSAYEKSKDENERAKKAEEAREKQRERREQQAKREQKENQLAHMEGLAKYHKMNTEAAEKYQEGIEAIRQLGLIMQQSVYQERKNDWAVLGGIAEGIAGPAAGIATAVNAINENARIEAENTARREWGTKQNAFYQELAMQAERERPEDISMEKLQRKYMAIFSWAPTTLFSLLTLSNKRIEKDPKTGAVTVSLSWQQIDRSICIDGALRAKIYTNFGQCAGCAYLVLPKEGTVGFKGTLSGICTRPKPGTYCMVVVEPVDLWELASTGNLAYRRTDNLTLMQHRRLVADSEARFLSELNGLIVGV